MLYGVTLSKTDFKVFQEKLGNLGTVVYSGYGFYIFHRVPSGTLLVSEGELV